MLKLKKRLVALLLAAATLIGVFPISAFAYDVTMELTQRTTVAYLSLPTYATCTTIPQNALGSARTNHSGSMAGIMYTASV